MRNKLLSIKMAVIIGAVMLMMVHSSFTAFAMNEEVGEACDIVSIEPVMEQATLELVVINNEEMMSEPNITEITEITLNDETLIQPETEQIVRTYSDEDIRLIAQMTFAEAEGENVLGKRLVIDTILNRVESDTFPSTVKGVLWQKNQFSSIDNGRFDRSKVTDEIVTLVNEEIVSKTNNEVVYFRTTKYSKYGTPVMQEGAHYFSAE